MWPKTFAERLESWNSLKQQVAALDLEPALETINTWWFQTPWTAYHLHWDERDTWPDPWQLLSDNIYCPLARGLGIMYTIALVDRPDLQDAVLAEFTSDNLVQIAGGKYILNWDPASMLNINPGKMNSRHSVAQAQIQQQIR